MSLLLTLTECKILLKGGQIKKYILYNSNCFIYFEKKNIKNSWLTRQKKLFNYISNDMFFAFELYSNLNKLHFD